MPLANRNRSNTQGRVVLFLTGFLMGSFLVGLTSLLIYWSGGIMWDSRQFIVWDILVALIVLILLAAAEEFIFRGLIYRKLSHRINRWLALFLSSLLFAIVHLSNPGLSPLAFVNIMLGGMVFCVTYMASRSLVFVTGFHTAWNFVQGPLLGFPVSGLPLESLLKAEISANELVSGGRFGAEASLICTFIFLIYLILHFRLLSR